MPRPSLYPDRLDCHFPPDTLRRMVAALRGGEVPVAFVREAVAKLLEAREAEAPKRMEYLGTADMVRVGDSPLYRVDMTTLKKSKKGSSTP